LESQRAQQRPASTIASSSKVTLGTAPYNLAAAGRCGYPDRERLDRENSQHQKPIELIKLVIWEMFNRNPVTSVSKSYI
jgi:hypothetical protein